MSNDTYHTRNRITSADTYVRYRAAFYGREVPPFQDPPIRPREGNEAPFLLHPTLYFRRRYIVRIYMYIYILRLGIIREISSFVNDYACVITQFLLEIIKTNDRGRGGLMKFSLIG